nr:transient receptor potential cation channel subfamily A member 2 [Apostichopus japonicus]
MAIIMNDRWREALDDCPVNQEPYILGLIKYLPDVALKEFDFRYLRCTQEEQSKFRLPGEAIEPLIVLNVRIDDKLYSTCVGIPLGYIRGKKNIIHIPVRPGALLDCLHLDNRSSSSTNIHTENKQNHLQQRRVPKVYSFSISSKSVRATEYLTEFTNIFEWVLYITSLTFVGPCLLSFSFATQWPCGAVAVFLAWFNFLLYLQRFDIFGIYVVMFLEILRTLCQVLVVFSILIIAFALTFHILLPHEENNAHSTPIASLLRVGMPFLLGELDFVNSFIEPSTDNDPFTLPYPILTFIFLFGLVLLLPILLINLLIGLAVGDIASMQRNAQLKRLAMQVELHSDLEQKLPNSILKAGDKERYTIQSNCAKFYLVQLWEKLRPARSGVESAYGNTSETEDEIQGDPQLAALKVELNHQKRRYNKFVEHDMLKLILQKMEIQSEAEERDEGVGPNSRGERKTLAKLSHFQLLSLSLVISISLLYPPPPSSCTASLVLNRLPHPAPPPSSFTASLVLYRLPHPAPTPSSCTASLVLHRLPHPAPLPSSYTSPCTSPRPAPTSSSCTDFLDRLPRSTPPPSSCTASLILHRLPHPAPPPSSYTTPLILHRPLVLHQLHRPAPTPSSCTVSLVLHRLHHHRPVLTRSGVIKILSVEESHTIAEIIQGLLNYDD